MNQIISGPCLRRRSVSNRRLRLSTSHIRFRCQNWFRPTRHTKKPNHHSSREHHALSVAGILPVVRLHVLRVHDSRWVSVTRGNWPRKVGYIRHIPKRNLLHCNRSLARNINGTKRFLKTTLTGNTDRISPDGFDSANILIQNGNLKFLPEQATVTHATSTAAGASVPRVRQVNSMRYQATTTDLKARVTSTIVAIHIPRYAAQRQPVASFRRRLSRHCLSDPTAKPNADMIAPAARLKEHFASPSKLSADFKLRPRPLTQRANATPPKRSATHAATLQTTAKNECSGPNWWLRIPKTLANHPCRQLKQPNAGKPVFPPGVFLPITRAQLYRL